MPKTKERLLVGTILSTVMLGSTHATPRHSVLVIAQASQTEQDKDKNKKPARPGPPQQQLQERQPQERQVQPPATPPGQQQLQEHLPRERQVPPPATPPGQQQLPERQPRERQVPPPATPPGQQQLQERQPRERRVPPPATPPGQEQLQERQPRERQVPPPATPPGQQQPPASQEQRQVQPPSQGVQPLPVPQQQQQQGRTGGGGPSIQPPPRPIAPQQPVGQPAIAPSAVQLPPPPPGSQAAQVQRAFVPPPAQDNARRLDDVRSARREVREGDRLLIEEPGRVIIQQGGQTIIRHNEDDRFRWQAQNVYIERRGGDMVTVFERPDGSRIYTVSDESGRLLRRYRRLPDGREIIIIDNRYSGPPSPIGYFVDLPPPVIRIPRERYIVEDEYAQPNDIYYALWAAPVDYIDRPYTLDEIRYSLPLRERMPRVDLNTVTFDTGSWEVAPDQVERLAVIADGINRAVAANPSEVFLIEGHTDAIGSDIDNLSLSDRRAESVALVLSQQFGVPPENLTTQGYGAHYLKVPTQGPERANRRVTVRRITPLLTGQNQPLPLVPR
jgi:outer membrane protein OmpA-like peptidoglycan-associated protein